MYNKANMVSISGKTLNKDNNVHWTQYLIAFLFFVIAYWGVTTNSDWGGYELLFENGGADTDKAFAYLSMWFNEHGLSYRMLYRFHIVLMALFYMFLFRKIKVNPIVLTLLTFLFNYVPLGNQIRYYVGFPMALLAMYYYIDKKYILTVFLGVLAFFFHSSLLMFYAIFLYYYYLNNITSRYKGILILIANLVLYYYIHNIYSSEHFDAYFTGEGISGLLGGLYNLFPSFIYISFAFRINKIIARNNFDYAKTNEYRYLYTCIMMGTVLFLCSIYTQIFAHRMMGLAMMPIWLTFFIKVKGIKNKRIEVLSNTAIVLLFIFYTIHDLGLITGSDEYIFHVNEMLNSYSFK